MQNNVIMMVEILTECSAYISQQGLGFDCQIRYGYYISGIWQLSETPSYSQFSFLNLQLFLRLVVISPILYKCIFFGSTARKCTMLLFLY